MTGLATAGSLIGILSGSSNTGEGTGIGGSGSGWDDGNWEGAVIETLITSPKSFFAEENGAEITVVSINSRCRTNERISSSFIATDR